MIYDEPTIRRNVLHCLSLLLPWEIEASTFFYYEANRFISWLAGISNLTPTVCAAVTSALSPRNNWTTNQLDAIALCQGSDRGAFNVVPRDLCRAQRILSGEPIPSVLIGPKTNAFYQNLLHPSSDVGIPIDRHIARVIYGHTLTEQQFTSSLSKRGEYQRLESLITSIAYSLDLRPIVLANRLWYVQRRLSSFSQQHSFPFHSLPWRPLYPGGSYPLKLHPRSIPALTLLPGCDYRPWLLDLPFPGPRYGCETYDHRGRVRVNLGKAHPYATSGGWQYRSRLVAMYEMNRRLRSDEHVHHNGPTDSPQHIEVLIVQLHGRLHASASVLAGYRDDMGKFVEHPEDRIFPWPRFGAITGPSVKNQY